MPKVDTVGDNYYKPLEQAEAVGAGLFWMVSILSIAALFVDKAAYPLAYDILQIVFIVCVVLFFFQGQAQKLYLFPRAEDKRRQELLSNSYNG
jgi:asparagine N-glycosylation enzyme membrane subunit Stt3